MLESLNVMLDFYGFSMNAEAVERSDNFELRADNWLHAGNHNLLRITRILKSLRLLGLDEYSESFFLALSELYIEHPAAIANSFTYWFNAKDANS